MAPFSGPTPTNGLALLQRARLASDELNQSGGVVGYRVQLLVVDEENDRSPFDVVSNPSVMAVLGHYGPHGVDLAKAEVREGFPGPVLGSVEATPIPRARP